MMIMLMIIITVKVVMMMIVIMMKMMERLRQPKLNIFHYWWFAEVNFNEMMVTVK